MATRNERGTGGDVAIVLRDVGSLLSIEAGLMVVTVVVALLFSERYSAIAFLLAATITGAVGLFARRSFADAPAPRMKHGMLIAAAGWLATAAFGALGFYLTAHLTPPSVAGSYVPAGAEYGSSLAHFRHPLHALFESMSGWTGSGLTMAVHEPTLPRAVLWWRSLMQWVGGVGVIVLTTAILARPGSGSYALYRSEAREEKIHPSVLGTVRTVWKLFVGFTLVAVVLLFVTLLVRTDIPAGEAAWQAVNHAMTGLSTGGFSVTDDSIATYDAPLVEVVLLPVMIVGAIAFPVHYAVIGRGRYRQLVGDLQTRWLLLLLVAGSGLLVLQNLFFSPALHGAFAGPGDAVRDSLFQFVSALTCTGFQSAPIGRWSSGGKIVLTTAMVLGGAAGSTVGGIKIIRGYLIARGIQWQFSRVFLPDSAVVAVRVGDRTLGRVEMEREFSEAAIVGLLWIGLLVASTLVLANVTPGYDYADVLFEVASAQGNVGLSTGITGPEMHPLAEAMFVLNMWIGRLEIIPVLVLLRSLLYGLEV